jgi:hypothetical protein
MENNDKAVIIMSQIASNEAHIQDIFWFMWKIYNKNFNYMHNNNALTSAVKHLNLDNLL